MDPRRIGELKARIETDPDNIPDRFVLLKLFFDGQAWTEAIAEGEELLRRQPDHILAHILLGESLLRSGKPAEAREVLLKARELANRFGHPKPKQQIEKLLTELG